MPFYPLYNSINFKVSKHKIRQKEFVKATVILAVEALKMDQTPTWNTDESTEIHTEEENRPSKE